MYDNKNTTQQKISIIIPHYNDFNGLTTLLESIPNIDAIQIIIVDDHSSIGFEDFTKHIAELNRNNVETYLNTGDRSAGSCRNIGLKYARGEWVLFADSDDYYVNDAFDTIMELCKQKEDIIYIKPTSIILPDGIPGNRHISYEKMLLNYLICKEKNTEIILKSGFIVPWSKMYRRKFLAENNIMFENVRWSNDVMFSVRSAFSAKNILAIDKEIYCVTRKKGSLTTQKNKEEYRTRCEVYIRKYLFLENLLSKKELKYAVSAPIGKIFKALSQGYGLNMAKYLVHRYHEENIPLFFFSYGTIKNALKDKILERIDKKYYTE